MNSTNFSKRTIGWLVLAIGAVTLLGIVSLILFFTVGGSFGALNDLCNAVEATLSAILAAQLYPWLRSQSAHLSSFALLSAWVGALVAVAGSALIIYGVTGWYLAGLYTMFGYAFIGLWLLGLNAAALRSGWLPRRLARLGLAAGACMAIGFLSSPGIVSGVDDPGAAPWFVNAGMLGSLGWMFLYPVWCFWLGCLLAANPVAPQAASQA